MKTYNDGLLVAVDIVKKHSMQAIELGAKASKADIEISNRLSLIHSELLTHLIVGDSIDTK